MLIYIILALIIVLCVFIMAINIYNYNKFQITIIKISEAEENISMILKEKYELLLKIDKLVKKKAKENMFEGLDEINVDFINNFELNKKLSKYDKTIIELTDYNKDIKFDSKDNKLFDDISNINVECKAYEKYYNDNVTIYNKLVSCFPSNVIAKVKKYRIKDFYSNEKEEIFEILKQ